jgi:hypothetical protein
MPDMSAIGGALSSLNAAINIVKAMKDLRDWSLVQSKVIELQSTILNAQGSLFAANEERTALIERIRELETQVAGVKAWDAEKDRYEKATVGEGAFAYVLKPSMRGTESPHYLCANCYSNSKASVLQHEWFPGPFGHILACPACKTKLFLGETYIPPA